MEQESHLLFYLSLFFSFFWKNKVLAHVTTEKKRLASRFAKAQKLAEEKGRSQMLFQMSCVLSPSLEFPCVFGVSDIAILQP